MVARANITAQILPPYPKQKMQRNEPAIVRGHHKLYGRKNNCCHCLLPLLLPLFAGPAHCRCAVPRVTTPPLGSHPQNMTHGCGVPPRAATWGLPTPAHLCLAAEDRMQKGKEGGCSSLSAGKHLHNLYLCFAPHPTCDVVSSFGALRRRPSHLRTCSQRSRLPIAARANRGPTRAAAAAYAGR